MGSANVLLDQFQQQFRVQLAHLGVVEGREFPYQLCSQPALDEQVRARGDGGECAEDGLDRVPVDEFVRLGPARAGQGLIQLLRRKHEGGTVPQLIQHSLVAIDESLQREAISYVRANPGVRDQLPFAGLTARCPDVDGIRANREAVEAGFSLDAYGRRLLGMYEGLMNAVPSDVAALDGEVMLDAFLAPEQFTLLRTGS